MLLTLARTGLVLACLVPAFAPTASAQTLSPRKATGTSSIGSVDEASAERSAKSKHQRQQQRGVTTMAATCPGTKVQVDIPPGITGTGFMERIVYQLPCGYPFGTPVPLIVVMNGYGLSANSFYNGMSDIPDEANARGWLVVAVTQLDDKSFGCWDKPQKNVEAAINYMIGNFDVDTTRIYGVGWSAGGGSIASYCARHLDPAKPMFAAIGVDAGSLDLVDSYFHEVQQVKTIMENVNLFQGPPAGGTYFNYVRTETVSLDAGGTSVPATTQARNLVQIPVMHTYSSDDTIPYLPLQNLNFANYLTSKGAPITSTAVSGLATPHSWDLLDAATLLNWFSTFTKKAYPANFELNADRSDKFYWSTLTQRSVQQYSSIAVTSNNAARLLKSKDMGNLTSVKLSPPPGVFSFLSNFTLEVENKDAGPLDLTLVGVNSAPSFVLNNANQTLFKAWVQAGSNLTLTIPALTSLSLNVNFDSYTAVLTGPLSAAVGSGHQLHLHAAVPNKALLLMLGLGEGATPISLFDPGDNRTVLVGFNPPPALLLAALDGAGNLNVGFAIPNDVQLVGQTLHSQFVTYPGTTTIIDEVSPRLDTALVGAGG